MNRRAEDRIEMKLPCRIGFPDVWRGPVEGETVNLHRNGVLVACNLTAQGCDFPTVGQRASARVELPSNPCFGQRYLDCETTLIRIRHTGPGQWQFALRVWKMNFTESRDLHAHLLDLAGDSCRYVI